MQSIMHESMVMMTYLGSSGMRGREFTLYLPRWMVFQYLSKLALLRSTANSTIPLNTRMIYKQFVILLLEIIAHESIEDVHKVTPELVNEDIKQLKHRKTDPFLVCNSARFKNTSVDIVHLRLYY